MPFNIVDFIENFKICFNEKVYCNSNSIIREIFVDTNDIIDIIRGIWLFDHFTTFDSKLFDSNKTLFSAFAYEGYISKLSLLPPHQEEFIGKLGQNHLFARHSEIGNSVSEFLSELGIDIVKIADKPTSNELKKYLNQLNTNAKDLFKVNYIFQTLKWQDRLAFVFKNLLTYDKEVPDFDKIISDSFFIRLKSELIQERPKVHRNNLVDAFSITILKEKLRKHKSNPKKYPLPIFYCSSTAVNAAIERLVKTEFYNDLNYKFDNETHISIIRSPLFFLIDAIFLNYDHKNSGSPLNEFSNQIRNLKDKITIKIDEFILTERILGVKKPEISTDIEKLIDIEFFKNIWYNEIGENKVLASILSYVHFKNNFKNEILKWTINERKIIDSNLTDNLNKYFIKQEEWIEKEEANRLNALMSLFSCFEQVKKDIFENKHKVIFESDVIKDFALTRFSFNENMCREIQIYYDRIINNYENQEYEILSHQIVNSMIFGLYTFDKTDLLSGIAILWVFNQYETIVTLLGKIDKYYFNYYQVPLIYASSLLRIGSENHERISNLIEELEDINKQDKNYKIQIGLSYLYFNFWRKMSDSISMLDLIGNEDENRIVAKTEYSFALKAINYLSDVLEFLDEKRRIIPEKRKYRNSKYYYSLNNYIYYVTIAGQFASFSKIEKRVAELLQIEDEKSQYWLSRFHDTLANYYYRKARNAKTDAEFIQYIKEAKERISIAIKLSKVQKTFYNLLLFKIDELIAKGFEDPNIR